jgi:hypothetical protein
MSRRPPLVCLWCGRVLPSGGADVVLHRLDWPTMRLRLAWHLECAAVDPLHEPQADVLSRELPSEEEARRITAAVLDLVQDGPARHGARWPFVARCAGLEVRR